MDLNPSLNLQMKQTLVLSPQLQQAIKLLQMPIMELVEKVDVELQENPFLEVKEEADDGADNRDERDALQDARNSTRIELDVEKRDVPGDYKEDDPELENLFEDSSDIGFPRKSNERRSADSKQNFLESAFPTQESIYDHLIRQLHLADIDENQLVIGEVIISSLDNNGYLKTDLEIIASHTNSVIEKVEDVLKIIQTFDPPGIAARDLREALILQIKDHSSPHPLAQEIISKYLPLLERKKYKEISQKIPASLDDVKEAVKFIGTLDPIPARNFDNKTIRYVVPDVIVQKTKEGFLISINDDYIPPLRVNNEYKKALTKEKLDPKTKKNMDEKFSDAKLLLDSLAKRRNTLLRVMEKIIEKQKGFFDKGPHHLSPLVLKDIAEAIEMHESTISRITKDKFVQTHWGIFELKFFFSNAIQRTGGGMAASKSIEKIIEEIISTAPPDKPPSDQKIVEILSNKGIKIARRTVAKYRKKLKIPPAHVRKVVK